jgi:nucleoside-diphosphate-sugar epimerase
LALSYFHSFNTPVSVVRPFNTYGPRQSARAVIPTVIGQIVAGHREIKLGALHPTRDFSYVADTVEGFVKALGSEQTIGRVTNLGSGFEIGIGDTARLIAELMDADVQIVSDEQRLRPVASEVDRLFAANGAARERMGWSPEYAGLDGFRRGLRHTIDWFREPKNLARYKTDIYNV